MTDPPPPFVLPRADALAVLREIDLVLVSLHRIASDDRARDDDWYGRELTRFVDGWRVPHRLAHARRLLDPAFDHELGEDDRDEAERACAGSPYWESPETAAAPFPEPPSTHVDGDAVLTAAIVAATRAALDEVRATHPGPFCVVALVTTGEALRPYLSVTLHGDGRWDLADSPLVIVGDEHFAALEPLYAARGHLHTMSSPDAEREYAVRLASMEAALRLLDGEGLFGVGEARGQVLLLVTTMPPDASDAGFARRLNAPGPLLTAWLEEASEGYDDPRG